MLVKSETRSVNKTAPGVKLKPSNTTLLAYAPPKHSTNKTFPGVKLKSLNTTLCINVATAPHSASNREPETVARFKSTGKTKLWGFGFQKWGLSWARAVGCGIVSELCPEITGRRQVLRQLPDMNMPVKNWTIIADWPASVNTSLPSAIICVVRRARGCSANGERQGHSARGYSINMAAGP